MPSSWHGGGVKDTQYYYQYYLSENLVLYSINYINFNSLIAQIVFN